MLISSIFTPTTQAGKDAGPITTQAAFAAAAFAELLLRACLPSPAAVVIVVVKPTNKKQQSSEWDAACRPAGSLCDGPRYV